MMLARLAGAYGYGGDIQDEGVKNPNYIYYDRNTRKMYKCLKQNQDISANVANFIPLDNNSLLEKLENLYKIENKTDYDILTILNRKFVVGSLETSGINATKKLVANGFSFKNSIVVATAKKDNCSVAVIHSGDNLDFSTLDATSGDNQNGICKVDFFILLKSSYIPEKGEAIADAIAKVWFGGQGIIGAILIGLAVGSIYTIFIQKHIVIKMPEQVPQAIAKQFEAMIPAFVIFLLSMVVYIIAKIATGGGTFIEMIYDVIQVPLQGLTGSLYGAIGIAFFISFLWWFGVHGQSVVNGVVTALLLSNLDANKALLAADKLSVSQGAHIVTQQFLDSFLILSGSGITFGVVVAMLFAAKSKQYKALGKVAAFPAIFNVNEPVVFGFPIVMNPVMFLPFVLVPVLAALIVYMAIAVGFMQPFAGVTLPWSTPAIISGFMVAGWQGAVIQIVILAMSAFVYFPFVKFQDKIAYNNELKNEE